MSSKIEITARALVEKMNKSNSYLKEDITAIVEAVKECDEQEKGPIYLEKAKNQWVDEGQIEIDDDAIVSVSENGAYVQAWVWVSDEE